MHNYQLVLNIKSNRKVTTEQHNNISVGSTAICRLQPLKQFHIHTPQLNE